MRGKQGTLNLAPMVLRHQPRSIAHVSTRSQNSGTDFVWQIKVHSLTLNSSIQKQKQRHVACVPLKSNLANVSYSGLRIARSMLTGRVKHLYTEAKSQLATSLWALCFCQCSKQDAHSSQHFQVTQLTFHWFAAVWNEMRWNASVGRREQAVLNPCK